MRKAPNRPSLVSDVPCHLQVSRVLLTCHGVTRMNSGSRHFQHVLSIAITSGIMHMRRLYIFACATYNLLELLVWDVKSPVSTPDVLSPTFEAQTKSTSAEPRRVFRVHSVFTSMSLLQMLLLAPPQSSIATRSSRRTFLRLNSKSRVRCVHTLVL